MTAIVLAGGKASRMHGRDKAFLKLNNQPLIKKQLRLLKRIFKQIIIVTNSPKKYRDFKGVKLIPDVTPGLGPLGGIFSGLLASQDKYNFVVACDMPFINLGLVKYMYKNASGYDIVVPKVKRRYEPLFCIYSKACLGYIQENLDKKIYRISKFFSKAKVKEITEREVLRFGLPEKVLMNINTKEDFIKL